MGSYGLEAGEGWNGGRRGWWRRGSLETVALGHGLANTTLDVAHHLCSAGRAEHVPRVHVVVVYRRGDGVLKQYQSLCR